MESFLIAFNAVTPFFVYMFYGFIMRRTGVTDDAFLHRLNKVVFRSFYPMIMFYNLYSIDPEMEFRLSFVLFGGALVIAIILVLLLTASVYERKYAHTIAYIESTAPLRTMKLMRTYT